MKRILGSVVVLGVMVLLLCFPALTFGGGSVQPNTEDTRISNYVADFEVARDGDLEVVETLTVSFPITGKHGIFRFWDRIDDNAPHARRTPEIESITRDGAEEPYELSREDSGRFVVAKIGSADTELSTGTHTYVLRYSIPGVLDENDEQVTGSDERSMFYWQLIPRGWNQAIERSRLTVRLPAAAQQDVKCAIGNDASSGCTVQGGGTRDLTVTTGSIEPRTPVTIATGLDLATPRAGHYVPWAGRWDNVLGQSLPVLVVVLLLAALATGLGARLGARSREKEPGFPVLYAPPEGIGPAQAKYVWSEKVDRTSYVATLMYAAEKGAVDLTRDGDDWTITDKSGARGWAGLDDVTVDTAHILGGEGASFTASKEDVTSGKRLLSEVGRFEKKVASWARESGTVVSGGLGGAGKWLVIGGFVLMLVCATVNPFSMTVVGLIPGGFAIGGGSLLAAGASTLRTPAGRDLWSRVGGFRRILATPSSIDRFDFSGRKELYTAYIPWAVALGCADEWAGKYRLETGEEPPTPHYFASSYAGASMGSSVDSMVDSFSGTVDSAISSYNATQTSSSGGGGGFSGGGFSGGGGGGGGGGGSW